MRKPHTAILHNAIYLTMSESAAAVKRKLANQGPANAVNTFFGSLEHGLKMNFRGKRRLVWTIDSGEVLQFAAPGFGVETLRVATLTLSQWYVDKDFKELATFEERAGMIALSTVGADERDDRDEAGIDKQARDLGNPANVFDAIGLGEAEIPIQAKANLVTVEQISVTSGNVHALFQRVRNRGFAGRRKACEPQAQWLLKLEFGAGLLVNIHRLSNKCVAGRSTSETIPEQPGVCWRSQA
jgi:hypothetical protein